jgi:hypothetical protein
LNQSWFLSIDLQKTEKMKKKYFILPMLLSVVCLSGGISAQALSESSKEFTTDLAPHGVRLVKVYPGNK